MSFLWPCKCVLSILLAPVLFCICQWLSCWHWHLSVLRCGLKTVINLQRPGEHASCGNPLEQESGFTYRPETFMEAGSECLSRFLSFIQFIFLSFFLSPIQLQTLYYLLFLKVHTEYFFYLTHLGIMHVLVSPLCHPLHAFFAWLALLRPVEWPNYTYFNEASCHSWRLNIYFLGWINIS